MDEQLKASLDQALAAAQRMRDAIERVRAKRAEISAIEAANGNSAVARMILSASEQELAHDCDHLERLIEQLDHFIDDE